MEDPARELDGLGFIVPRLTEQQIADRQRSQRAAGASGAKEWAKAQRKGRLPQPRVLKRLLRKV